MHRGKEIGQTRRLLKKATLYLLVPLLIPLHQLQASAPGALAFAASGVGAWHQGIGGNGVAYDSPEFTAYWNPALLGLHQQRLLTIEHGEWFAGELKKDIFELDIPAGSGRAFALNVIRSSVRSIPLSSRLEQGGVIGGANRPVIDDYVNSAQWQFSIAAGMQLREGWRLGGSTKLIYENIADLNAWGLGLDLGSWYRWRQLTLGLLLRDAVTTHLFWNSGLQEVVLPSICLGAGWRQPLPSSALLLFASARHDLNGVDYNDYGDELSVELQAGLAWHFRELFQLGVGWDGSRLTAGTGIKVRRFGLNYALFKQHVLGATHLVTLTADLTGLTGISHLFE